ncbi:hypothetical protein AVEN_65722-1 [Araneus ventricosus]|uniref:Uncharacterized protein n=1 Tax=Araneus ventricosus TaxID=182803 RepID=A0A4Y2UJE9_ARAVE|nr:hypothetical protein AVEN_65722-1 [Araneus ventricosus]
MLLILLFRHENEVDRLKSVCVQASEELHMLLETPARNRTKEVGVCASASRFTCVAGTPRSYRCRRSSVAILDSRSVFVGSGTCASSNCSLYTTNGMLQTGFKPVDTNRCVCKGPKGTALHWALVGVRKVGRFTTHLRSSCVIPSGTPFILRLVWSGRPAVGKGETSQYGKLSKNKGSNSLHHLKKYQK